MLKKSTLPPEWIKEANIDEQAVDVIDCEKVSESCEPPVGGTFHACYMGIMKKRTLICH